MTTKAMNVKISTAKLISALDKALQQRVDQQAKYEAERAKYEKEHEAFVKSLVELIGTKKLSLKNTIVREVWRRDGDYEVEFTFDMPKMTPPQAPERAYNFHYNNSAQNELKNAIAILKMTDEQYVSASTYKGVAQYL
jgi:vacuolar-type H+-ATPase catalytic subunit A/Vma1